jgi:hypothetical protein
LVAQLLSFLGIICVSEAFGQLEERLLFLFPRFDAQLDEFEQNAIIAEALAFGETIYLFGNGCGERHAPSDMLGNRHYIIMHHFGALMAAGKNSKCPPCVCKKTR